PVLGAVHAVQLSAASHRELEGDVGFQVHDLGGRGFQVVDEVLGELADSGAQTLGAARGESLGGALAKAPVFGTVGTQQVGGGGRDGAEQRPPLGDPTLLVVVPVGDVLDQSGVGEQGTGGLVVGDRPGVHASGEFDPGHGAGRVQDLPLGGQITNVGVQDDGLSGVVV